MSSAASLLPVLAVMMPAAGVVALFARTRRGVEWMAFLFYASSLAVSIAIAVRIAQARAPLFYDIGNWAPPLGIRLVADGTSAVMSLTATLIVGLVGAAAMPRFATSERADEQRRPVAFWPLLLALLCAINLAVLAQDLFTIFVALELLTFAAVPLVALEGTADTIRAALRYLLFALAGSGLFLLGVALLYLRYATLDIGTLAQLAGPADALAFGLMTAGLLAKTALFPLHLWLPPAHAGAPPPASAVLSALVVKAPYLIIVRLWFELPVANLPAAQLLAILGSLSILWCSVLALRQARLKLMIAYSTVAQIGYLFLVFPLAIGSDDPWVSLGWSGAMLQLISHAFAKAAMFLAAGLIAEALGHDRIDSLAGAARAAPLSVLAFALAGLSLMGLPPSGGFNAKAMLLSAAVALDQWWIAVTILAGGVLAAGYVFRVIARATAAPDSAVPLAVVSKFREVVPLALAICALGAGFVPLRPFAFLGIGATP